MMSDEASGSNGSATLRPSKPSQFSPPGNLLDLTPDNRSLWLKTRISKWVNDEISGSWPGRIPLKQFFNGTDTAYHIGQDGIKITWIGFPNRVGNHPNRLQRRLILPGSPKRLVTMRRRDGRPQIRPVTSRMSTWSGLWSGTMRRISSELHSPAKAQK